MKINHESLNIDAESEIQRIVAALQRQVRQKMRRHGAVIGISGGVDSSVVLALCVRAFGPQKVTAVIMPEKDSDPESELLARQLAGHYGVVPLLENITPILEGFGCYRRRDEAIRRIFPQYDASHGYTAKIVLPNNLLDEGTLNAFSIIIVAPDGSESSKPLPTSEFLQIVAASNFKQRTRMAMLYYHAELNHHAVIGTANKNEHDQGFFVKYGDSGVDIKAISHLFKTQVYQLAMHLGVPDEIQKRAPTTDTYSARCTQEEFFFRLPFKTMDLLWYAQEQNVKPCEVAKLMGLSEQQVGHAFQDFKRKHQTTEYLRLPPQDIDDCAAPPTKHITPKNESFQTI